MWRCDEEKRKQKRVGSGGGWRVLNADVVHKFDARSGSNQSIFDELSNELRQPRHQYYTVHIRIQYMM